MKTVLIIVATVIFAPIIAALLSGIDRRITARLQGRFGPPILQPFYDIFKLLSKEKVIANRFQIFFAYIYLFSAALALVLLVLQQDLLVVVFVMAVGGSCLVLGAMSCKSPYSQVGCHREIMQILSYEPILLLMVVGVYLVTGSFSVEAIINYEAPLLLTMPLIFVAVGIALTIKMRKSPFDISASHHAHQEIVRGVLTEFSGPYLAIVEIAHFYELMIVLVLTGLFWATSFWGALILVAEMFLVELIIDNITARLTWRWMLKFTWVVGIGLSVINLAWLYI